MSEPYEVNAMLADTFEPKRQNRFLFQFLDDALPAYVAKTASRPSFQQESITIDYMNTKRYLAGKAEWQEMTISLHDPIAPSSAQRVMEWVRLAHETISGRDGYAAFYKKNFQLVGLDPVGAPVELWEVRGAFITAATFGDYDYASAEPMQVEITVRPDECILRY